ncbi:MAG: MlaD family protein [Bacteroidales bacterium]
MKISREFKVGITFLAAAAVFIWGFNFLKGTDLFSSKRVFYAVYDQVNGLDRANKVKVNGLNIGQVQNLSFIPGTSRIVAEMYIKSDIEIPANSVARIYGTDLLGGKAIEINLGDTNVMAESGDTLRASMEQSLMTQLNEQVEPLKLKAIALINSVDSVLTVIQSVFNESTRDNLATSFENIQNTLGNVKRASSNVDTILATEKSRINRIMTNVESISVNLRENNENINRIFNNIALMSDSLQAAEIPEALRDFRQTAQNLQQISQNLKDGEGTAGKLLYNDSLYIRLEETTYQLKLLLEDIQNNPSRYVKFSLF